MRLESSSQRAGPIAEEETLRNAGPILPPVPFTRTTGRWAWAALAAMSATMVAYRQLRCLVIRESYPRGEARANERTRVFSTTTDVRGTWTRVPGMASTPKGAMDILQRIDPTPNTVPRLRPALFVLPLSMAPFGRYASQGTWYQVPRTSVKKTVTTQNRYPNPMYIAAVDCDECPTSVVTTKLGPIARCTPPP